MKSEKIRKKLQEFIVNFEHELGSGDLRGKVLALVPCFRHRRELGNSLIPAEVAKSARDRILHYFLKYPRVILSGNELLVVSGIQEYARRVRELKVQFGWSIISGVTAKEMATENEFFLKDVDSESMGPSDYILISEKQDRDAAFRWQLANDIRKEKTGVRDKILKYFRKNVGKEITGRPDLDVGVYLLEADRQSPEHDRKITDPVKCEVLKRDGHQCTKCRWNHKQWNRSDPRHLELHHIMPHAKGGKNTADNLITLCTVCHDAVHRH